MLRAAYTVKLFSGIKLPYARLQIYLSTNEHERKLAEFLNQRYAGKLKVK